MELGTLMWDMMKATGKVVVFLFSFILKFSKVAEDFEFSKLFESLSFSGLS